MTTATYTTRAILQARQPWQSRRKYKVPGHGRHWIHEADVVSWTQDRQGYGGDGDIRIAYGLGQGARAHR